MGDTAEVEGASGTAAGHWKLRKGLPGLRCQQRGYNGYQGRSGACMHACSVHGQALKPSGQSTASAKVQNAVSIDAVSIGDSCPAPVTVWPWPFASDRTLHRETQPAVSHAWHVEEHVAVPC